jgi:beta-lactamase superfamily II metal-dependent hydrolase
MEDIFKKYRRKQKFDSTFIKQFIKNIFIILLVLVTGYNIFRYSIILNNHFKIKSVLNKKYSFKKNSDQLLTVFFKDKNSEAVLLHTPNNKIILVDTGKYYDSDNSKIIFNNSPITLENKILNYLLNQKIYKIDYILFTGLSNNKISGLLNLIDCIQINKIIFPEYTKKSDWLKKIENKISILNIDYDTIKSEKQLDLGKDIFCKTVFANAYPVNLSESKTSYYFKYKNISFIIHGNLNVKEINKVISSYGSNLKSNLIKIGCNDKIKMFNKIWLDTISPEYSVIFKPETENPELNKTVNYLKELGSKIMYPHKTNDIFMITDGIKLNFFTD